ncbi:hypothetical protein BDD43_1486 [Mucilaginibacter gracilis]|uniref:Uncharacterized protein n=1 Tax=Mucilaginibacter gracilis TaxID=423350 RepID=A0A495IY85_9SPHI|nr:hypothetical protein [Mucilaginibacter gracilis]RKR81341.1 hypothetical protein BDD43_1486 [Mucilaginibacter gracilis]
MHFEEWDCELDHPYHQFDCVTYTEELADFSVSLCNWMTHIGSLKTGI